MEKKGENKRFDLKKLIVIAAVAVLIVATALAWFVYTSDPFNNSFGLSNFNTELDCYFMDNGTRINLSDITGVIDTDTKLINLSLDPDDDNYFANFHVDVKYKGKGHGYLRVKVVTEAKDSSGYATLTDSKIPYTLSAEYSDNQGNNQAAWYDNRNMDFCYYYATALSGNDSTLATLSVITGAQTTDIDSGFDAAYLLENNYTLSVAVSSDMVQINRYPQFWGINTLPWK
ncbi:MAG: hypothetical protein IJS17_07275 [Clostridia bacterium]|nr:hypothetical protein [Clostridia bacterium]